MDEMEKSNEWKQKNKYGSLVLQHHQFALTSNEFEISVQVIKLAWAIVWAKKIL